MRFDIDFSLVDPWLQNSMNPECHIVMTLSIDSAGWWWVSLPLVRSRPVRARFVVEIIVHWVRTIRPVLSNWIPNGLRCVNSAISSLQLDFAGLRSFRFA